MAEAIIGMFVALFIFTVNLAKATSDFATPDRNE
jgi:hypothetical protein